ncbi:large proline-rich protein BAG6 [Neocloeon triangulifer]|uniref:large proline-rich protein BAG6 n=1 Tax=Neocloeon triangulifer TaxID=2078957 RepID=UPI00286F0150|nr:large proline-rich protein BAG6 [Neocloeon triangulifer]
MASLLDITVKTLDSQNHKFNLAEDKTVKDFKDEIEKVVNIPANSQRLIYCGRVLQDEKQLKEYNLDKKVVHLVQRVPPTQRPHTAGASTSTRSSATNSPRRINISTARGFDSNTLDMIHLAAHNRISLVNHMLSRAENCVARLEDPTVAPYPPADHINMSALTAEGADAFVGPELAGTLTTSISVSDSPEGNNPTTLGGAVSAAVAGALSAIVSAVNTSMGGNTNITVGAPNITVTSMSSDVPMDSPPHPTSSEEAPVPPPASASSENAPASAGATAGQEQPSSSSSTSTSSPSAQQRPRRGSPISAMADSIDHMNRIQDRLRPFSDEMNRIMREDPAVASFEGQNNTLEDVQRRFSLVSETMHFISHAYHHLSDLSLGLTRPPPRTLGVRSLVLQPAFVQGVGIPVQAQINVVSGHISPQQASPSHGSTSPPTANPASTPAATAEQPPQADQPGRPQMVPEFMVGPTFEARRSSFTLPSGGNVEVVMEMTPGSLTYVPGQSGGGGGGQHNHFHHVHEASPDLMRAIIMHAMSHQMGGGQGGQSGQPASAPTSNSSASPSAAAAAGAGAAPSSGGATGQNSQARGTTTTNPTTSTQTRSTPRPHVHLAPVNVPVSMSNMFDPYLMCSSHHIHARRRQTEPTQTTTTASAAAQSAPSTPTRQPTAPQQPPSQPRPPPPPGAINVDDILRRSLLDIIPHDSFANWRMPTINWPTAPDHEASVFSSIINTVTQNLTLEDILQLSFQQGTPLSRIRTPLREIVNQQLMRGEPVTPENTNQAVERIMHEIPIVNMLQTWNQLRPGLNVAESFRRFYRDQLTSFLELINNDSITPNQFGPRLLGFSGQFLRYLTSLTMLFCRDGRRGLEEFIGSTVNRLIPSPSTPTPMAVLHGRNSMSAYFLSMQIDTPAVERFVQRVSATPDLTATTPAESQTATPRTAAAVEAMECDEEFVLAAEELPTQQVLPPPEEVEEGAIVLPPMGTDSSAACDVVVGAEEWHTGLDPDWVPVISRDIQRQRRQPDQAPFSDSYLSGMSSKRRKLVSGSKPQGSVDQVIAKSVATAATAAGVSNAEQLAKAASSDTTLQAAYKEEVKKSVQQQLSLNPDFSAERHPNANKYFKPTKQ